MGKCTVRLVIAVSVVTALAACEKKAPEAEPPVVEAEAPAAEPAAPAPEPAAAPATGDAADSMSGGVSVESKASVAETVAALQGAIEAKGLTLFAVVDHAANAKKAGLELRPTTVVIFGNPKIGTKLMAAGQTVGLNLPMKMLVYETADGKTHVVYEDPRSLAERHGLQGIDPVLDKVSGALAGLAKAAAGQ